MTKYYMIDCIEPFDWDDSAVLRSVPLPEGEKSWRFGHPFKTRPKEPILIELVDTHSDRLLELYKISALVMTKRLHNTLKSGGVYNLDVYETIIRHPKTGFETGEYVAANLVGSVAAADLDSSIVVGGSTDRLIDVDFDSVALKPEHANALLMFRLSENTSAVVVHERLRQHLVSQGFTNLDFIPPEEWLG